MEKAIVKAQPTGLATTVGVDAVVEDWLSESRSLNTRQAYAGDLLDFCRTVYGTDDVAAALRHFLTLSEIEAGLTLTRFRQALRERGLKPNSVNRKLSALRAFVDHARRRGIVSWRVNDLVRGEKERTDRAERVRLRLPAASVEGLTETLQRLFAVLPRKGVRALRDRAIVALMGLHGLRRVEVQRLSVADLLADADGMALRVWGKGDKFRIVRLRADTSRLMQAYLQALKRARIEPKPDAIGIPVFVSLRKGKGARLTLHQINNIVNAIMTQAGVKRAGLSCHSLRHAFATLAAQDVPLPDLAAYLGHADLYTTGVYAHALGAVNPSVSIKVRAI